MGVIHQNLSVKHSSRSLYLRLSLSLSALSNCHPTSSGSRSSPQTSYYKYFNIVVANISSSVVYVYYNQNKYLEVLTEGVCICVCFSVYSRLVSISIFSASCLEST